MSSSFRLFEYPLMPAALHSSMRSGTVFFFSNTRSCGDALPAGAGALPPASVMTVSSPPLDASLPSLLHAIESSITLQRGPFSAHRSCQCSRLAAVAAGERRPQQTTPPAPVSGPGAGAISAGRRIRRKSAGSHHSRRSRCTPARQLDLGDDHSAAGARGLRKLHVCALTSATQSVVPEEHTDGISPTSLSHHRCSTKKADSTTSMAPNASAQRY